MCVYIISEDGWVEVQVGGLRFGGIFEFPSR